MIVGQYLPGMDIRRRDDRLSDRHRIAQRARGHLGHVEVGRDIDVGRLEHVEQLFLLDKAVDEADMVLDA